MKKLLVVIDMQVDFVSGALGTKEAEAIVPAVVEKITEFDGDVVYTRDTHTEQYLTTAEGKKTACGPLRQGYTGLANPPCGSESRRGQDRSHH